MDTTSLTKRLKIEIDGWLSLGGIETSKEEIRDIKKEWNLGPKEDVIFRSLPLSFFMLPLSFFICLRVPFVFLQTMLST